MQHDIRRLDRIEGVLLGTAMGDALGLPMEGLSARTIRTRFGPRVERFHLLARRGFVSDDTEQSALTAEALLVGQGDVERTEAALRRLLRGWFLRLPFGIGLSTLRACLRLCLGIRRSGVASAGNGAAMRSAIVGAHLSDDPELRRALTRRLAEITHTDPRGMQGALYVAELEHISKIPAAPSERDTTRCGVAEPRNPSRIPSVRRLASGRVSLEIRSRPFLRCALTALCINAPSLAARAALVSHAAEVVANVELRQAVRRAEALGSLKEELEASRLEAELGTTGYVVHSAALATYVFLRHGGAPLAAVQAAIAAGGDTDTNAAIVGGWVGALHGARALPPRLLDGISDGPFGPTHLRALARALSHGGDAPSWSPGRALLRNLALYPVILGHGMLRLLPVLPWRRLLAGRRAQP